MVGALVDAAQRHDLPLSELAPYMRSMRVDCAPVRIGSWDELVAYMEGSAGSVGRIMAPLLGVPEAHHADYGRLGLAFQHTNFVRDVRRGLPAGPHLPPAGGPRSLRGRGGRLRPRERLAGAARADRARGRARPPPVRGGRARPSIAAPATVRPGIRLACAVYESVLDRVEAAGYDVLGRRMGVRLWRLPMLAYGALRR